MMINPVLEAKKQAHELILSAAAVDKLEEVYSK